MHRIITSRRAWSASTCFLLAAGCAATAPTEITWEPVVCYEAAAAIERVRCGRPDPSDPGLQAVSVDQAGDVALMHFADGVPRSEVLYRHGDELTGLVISDVDPTPAGAEIYVGGAAVGGNKESPSGVVLQLVVTQDPHRRALVRRIGTCSAYVHSIERVEPQTDGDVARLLVSTYAGEIHLLTPTAGDGLWQDRLLYREPPLQDPEAPKVKDAAFLVDPTGRPPHEALLVSKTGRTLLLDLDRPQQTRLIHEEVGGLSRVTSDRNGGAYVTGYFGRLLHFVRDAGALRVEVLEQEGSDSGLRGVVLGDFPVTGATAHMVIFGFHKLCRALLPHAGVLDPLTLYVDVDRGHALEAADLVPDNDADELLIGGYSKRVTMLVAKRRAGNASSR